MQVVPSQMYAHLAGRLLGLGGQREGVMQHAHELQLLPRRLVGRLQLRQQRPWVAAALFLRRMHTRPHTMSEQASPHEAGPKDLLGGSPVGCKDTDDTPNFSGFCPPG